MELNKLYDIADKEKIYIREKRLEEAKGMYIACNDIDVILLNKKAINKNTEELCVLAEELRSLLLQCLLSFRMYK